MKAKKYTCIIKTETLSPDSIYALVAEANNLITNENQSVKISKDDGDFLEWSIESKEVEF